MGALEVFVVVATDEHDNQQFIYHKSKPYQTLKGAEKEMERLTKQGFKWLKIIKADKWSDVI